MYAAIFQQSDCDAEQHQSFQNDMTLMNEVWNILADMLEAMRYAKASYQQCGAEVNAVVSAINAGGKGRF